MQYSMCRAKFMTTSPSSFFSSFTILPPLLDFPVNNVCPVIVIHYIRHTLALYYIYTCTEHKKLPQSRNYIPLFFHVFIESNHITLSYPIYGMGIVIQYNFLFPFVAIWLQQHKYRVAVPVNSCCAVVLTFTIIIRWSNKTQLRNTFPFVTIPIDIHLHWWIHSLYQLPGGVKKQDFYRSAIFSYTFSQFQAAEKEGKKDKKTIGPHWNNILK